MSRPALCDKNIQLIELSYSKVQAIQCDGTIDLTVDTTKIKDQFALDKDPHFVVCRDKKPC